MSGTEFYLKIVRVPSDPSTRYQVILVTDCRNELLYDTPNYQQAADWAYSARAMYGHEVRDLT